MSYKRIILPREERSRGQLTSDMAGIGMHFNAFPNREANIEDTIYFASIDGMIGKDLRTLSVMVKWLESYYRWINVGRLTKIVSCCEHDRVKAFWTAVAIWKNTDIRFKKLSQIYKGPRVEVIMPPFDSSYHYMKHGENRRFSDGPLGVPANVLRDREMDVVPPDKTAIDNLFVRYRIMMGPTYRSDMWAALQINPDLTPAELARQTYGSFPVAWQVKKDWEIVRHGRRRRKKKNIA
ncbi:MAG: hypothetical protein JRJ87_23425 [Deltaproteobacteria bacterium]|nr:hypothetical protein [Deltaproteobacteria bacterium]